MRFYAIIVMTKTDQILNTSSGGWTNADLNCSELEGMTVVSRHYYRYESDRMLVMSMEPSIELRSAPWSSVEVVHVDTFS